MEDIMDFDDSRKGTGTNEWAEVTENIARGCPHNCLYCYAATNANRFKLRDRADWAREELTKRADITSYPARGGVIMFPSAHDITPFNLDAYVRVAKLMLNAGNKLLIVSKPHLNCIVRLCEEFNDFKDQILFRFTIGTISEIVAKFWEPGAPSPGERLEALRHAFESGFRTSVSAEPLLGNINTASRLLAMSRPFITDTIWIGKMNKIRTRVDMSTSIAREMVEEIEAAQTDAEVLRMFRSLDSDPLVRWKDSIKEVVASYKSSSGPRKR